jgi:hypothetical protein
MRLIMSRDWKGVHKVVIYNQFSCNYPHIIWRKLLNSNCDALIITCDHNLVMNLIIEKLVEDPKLKAAHTVIRSRYNYDPANVTFA